MENRFLVVKDEQGIMRPLAGIWRLNAEGIISANDYKKKNSEVLIIVVELREIELYKTI